MTIFTARQINEALGLLISENDLVLPFGIWPVQTPNGRQLESLDWDSYDYNPPEHWRHFPRYSESDPLASPKPTSVTIEEKLAQGDRARFLSHALAAIHAECRQRIITAYGAEDWQAEIESRLGGRTNTAQDEERDRLRARYQIIKSWVQDEARTFTELENFDASDDEHWNVPSE